MSEILFSDYIKSINKLVIVRVPLIFENIKVAKIYMRYLSPFFEKIYIVTGEKNKKYMENNDFYITKDQIDEIQRNESLESPENILFIFENLYLYKKNNYKNLLLKGFSTFENNFILNENDFDIFESNFTNMEIKVEIIDRYNRMNEEHEKKYKEIKENNLNVKFLSSYGNIFLDKIIKSTTEVNKLNKIFNRTPKMKNLFLDLLLNNKNRHIIYMSDNKYGLPAFKDIYEKIDKKNKLPPLFIISDNDSDKEIINKVNIFNSIKAPYVLVTSRYLENIIVPNNINDIRILNIDMEGSAIKDFKKIVLAKNYSLNRYPRSINVIFYSNKMKNDESIDSVINRNNKKILYELLAEYNENSGDLFIKEDKIYLDLK